MCCIEEYIFKSFLLLFSRLPVVSDCPAGQTARITSNLHATTPMAVSRVPSPPLPEANTPVAENWCYTQVRLFIIHTYKYMHYKSRTMKIIVWVLIILLLFAMYIDGIQCLDKNFSFSLWKLPWVILFHFKNLIGLSVNGNCCLRATTWLELCNYLCSLSS